MHIGMSRRSVVSPVVVHSLLTDLGIARGIPMPVHRALDVPGGAFLAISPWRFRFADDIRRPHLLFGLREIGVGLMTHGYPGHVVATPRRPAANSQTSRLGAVGCRSVNPAPHWCCNR